MKKTKFCSWNSGRLPEGCQLCVQGRKTVLFITGLCTTKCFYCPISDIKMNRDVIYANEMPVDGVKQVIEEIRLCGSQGVGITGGDPLVKLDRTADYIRQLKKTFGKKFHIHLYTPLTLVTEQKLAQLWKAGLDEIRFHPSLYSSAEWHRLELALRFPWQIGVEIPSLPGREQMTKQLIEFISGKVSFLNINELEISDTNANHLIEKGFKPKDRISYGVKGSQELALRLAKYAESKIPNVHYCTAMLKDRVQLAKRIKLRAKKVAQRFDSVSSEGILTRGAVYLPELKPGFGYRKSIAAIKNRAVYQKKLEQLGKSLRAQYKIPADMIRVDMRKLRLLTSAAFAKKIRGCPRAIVKEYPTYDLFEVEIRFL